MTLWADAYAKVNLHLEVLFARDDGYHEIESIMQTIELHDRLSFESTKGPIHIRCSDPRVPTDHTNLCHSAAMILRKRLGVRKGAAITIEKNIPVAAGLGGGSADAAAALLALVRLWDRDVDEQELHLMAARLGADVPFFLRGGTQLARGIGEQLRPLNSSGGGVYLVITPPIALSTAWVYERLRMGLTRRIPKVNLQTYKALLSRFPERNWPGFNRLGDVVFPAFPQLHRLFLGLQDTHPRMVMLSGSGPTLFAVYSDEEQARMALETMPARGAFTWIGSSTRQGVRLLDR